MNIPLLLSPKVKTAYLESDMTLRQALEKFRAHGYTAVPVLTSDGYYKGTVSEGDFLRYILEVGEVSMKDMESAKLSDIMTRDTVPSLNVDSSIEELTERLFSANFVSIVDARGCFIGIVTRKSLLEYFKRQISYDPAENEWDGK